MGSDDSKGLPLTGGPRELFNVIVNVSGDQNEFLSEGPKLPVAPLPGIYIDA